MDKKVRVVKSHTPTTKYENGLAVGPSHKENGIPGIVKSTGEPIEFQGGEVIIKKESVEIPGNCEKLSEINQSGGGEKIPCHLKERMEKNKFEQGGLTSDSSQETIKKPIQEFTGYRYFEGLDPLSVDHQSNFKYGTGICLCTASDKVADLTKSRVCMTVQAINPLIFESTGSEPNINFTRAWVQAGTSGPDTFAEIVFDSLGHDVMIVKYNTERGDDIVFKDKSIVKGYEGVRKFEDGGNIPHKDDKALWEMSKQEWDAYWLEDRNKKWGEKRKTLSLVDQSVGDKLYQDNRDWAKSKGYDVYKPEEIKKPFITQDGPCTKDTGRSYPLKPSKDSIVIDDIESYDDQTLSEILAFEVALKYTTDTKAKKELNEAIQALKISQKYK